MRLDLRLNYSLNLKLSLTLNLRLYLRLYLRPQPLNTVLVHLPHLLLQLLHYTLLLPDFCLLLHLLPKNYCLLFKLDTDCILGP